jgi:hypothetical protein
MESPDDNAPAVWTGQPVESVPHIGGGLIGKSQTQYIAGVSIGFIQYAGHAHAEQLGLAGAGPCYYEHWAVYRIYGFTLTVIQFFVFFLKRGHQ